MDTVLKEIGNQMSDELLKGVSGGNRVNLDYYTVLAGDTLSSIAESFGITLEQLCRMNALSSDYVPAVGERLVVPAAG